MSVYITTTLASVSSLNMGWIIMPVGSFAGLGFLAWYMSGKIKVFDRNGHVAKLCIVFAPLLLAALVGVSRVDDYWHHWQDVFAGGLLGISYTILGILGFSYVLLVYYFMIIICNGSSCRADSGFILLLTIFPSAI